MGAFTKAIVLFVVYLLPYLVIAAGIVLPVAPILKKRRLPILILPTREVRNSGK